MSWDVASVFLHNNLSSLSTLWRAQVSPGEKHDAAPPVLHSWDDVLRLASFPLFPSNVTLVIMAKQFNFSFIRPQDMSPKIKVFLSMYICKLIWLFYVAIEVMSSTLLQGVSAHVGTGLVWLWIMTLSFQLHPASSEGGLLLFCGWYTHFTPKHVHLWDTEPVSFLGSMGAGPFHGVYTWL